MGIEYVEHLAAPGDGVLWKAGGLITSVREGTSTQKNWSGFGGEEKAREALACWQSLGWKGAPMSAASFFREMFGQMKRKGQIKSAMNATANHFASKGFYGGWIEVLQKGSCMGPLFHYDLNSAYLWAGGQGLPLMIRAYNPGDKNFMVLARIKSAKEYIPKSMRVRELVLLTNEDIEYYGIDAEIMRGVSWEEARWGPDDVLSELIDHVPFWLFKKMTQSYWGVWAARKPIVAQSFKGGVLQREWELRNRFQNLIWAQLIISRVTRHVHQEARKGCRLIYVDSVLLDVEIETGSRIGDWKPVETFPRGVFIRAPGVWARYPDQARRSVAYWYKHAGYAGVET
jgi:hypothetical protein